MIRVIQFGPISAYAGKPSLLLATGSAHFPNWCTRPILVNVCGGRVRSLGWWNGSKETTAREVWVGHSRSKQRSCKQWWQWPLICRLWGWQENTGKIHRSVRREGYRVLLRAALAFGPPGVHVNTRPPVLFCSAASGGRRRKHVFLPWTPCRWLTSPSLFWNPTLTWRWPAATSWK